jgi:hypothetical protein
VSVACAPLRPTEHRRRPSCDAPHPRSFQVGSRQARSLLNGESESHDGLAQGRPISTRLHNSGRPSYGVCHWMSSALHLHPWNRRPATNVHAGSANAIKWEGPLSKGTVDGRLHRPACCFPRGGTVHLHPRLSPSHIQMAAFPSPKPFALAAPKGAAAKVLSGHIGRPPLKPDQGRMDVGGDIRFCQRRLRREFVSGSQHNPRPAN